MSTFYLFTFYQLTILPFKHLPINRVITLPCYHVTMLPCEQPILDASYSSVMYTGGLGTAMIPKVLSNMLCGLQVCAMAEAMLIG